MENILRKRRSVRVFSERVIEKKLLEEICLDGLQAPSARNTRPWEIVIIQEKEKLKRISELRAPWKCLQGAAAAIVISAKKDDYYQQNCAAMAENMLISATEKGIGSVWLGLYPHIEESEMLRLLLKCPEGIQPFCVIALGYPEAEDVFYEKAVEKEKIHWEKW